MNPLRASRPAFRRTPIALAAAALTALPLAIAAPGPAGGEFQLNTVTAGSQILTDVAMDDAGNFVALWMSALADGTTGIMARRYDNAGRPQGPEFQVNRAALAGRSTGQFANAFVSPHVAMDGDGDFVVAWGQPGNPDGGSCNGYTTGYDYGVMARRYNAAGVPQGNEFVVNQTADCNQFGTSVAMGHDGEFAITWQGYDASGHGIYARRYHADGTPATGEFLANQVTAGRQSRSTSVIDGSNRLIVAWHSRGADGSGYAIATRRFDGSGAPLGNEMIVNQSTAGDQTFPAVATDAAGDFWVAWSTYDAYGGPERGTRARRYHADGTPATGEIAVNTSPLLAGSQFLPSVAMDRDGDAVITWPILLGGRRGSEVLAQRYDATGAPVGGEFAVNVTTAFNQGGSQVASDADGDFVIGWDTELQDGSGDGAAARRFQGPENVDLRVEVSGPAGPVGPGGALTYVVTVTNQHAASPVAGVGLATHVQSLVYLFNADPQTVGGEGWTCQTTVFEGTGYDDCRHDVPLLPGQSASYTVTASAGTDLSQPATFEADQEHDQYDANRGDDVVDANVAIVADSTPDAFTFADRSNVKTGTVYTSLPITVTGLTVAAPIAVSGTPTRMYSINGGAFVNTADVVHNGDSVRVQARSSSSASAAVNVTVDIGGVTDKWTLTTGATDTTPDAFGFPEVTGAARGAIVTSASVTVTGINAAVPVGLTGTATNKQYSINGGAFITSGGMVNAGDTVTLRMTSASLGNKTTNITANIGGVTSLWKVTTGP